MLKFNKTQDRKIKYTISIFAFVVLAVLGVKYFTVMRRDLIFDVLASLLIVGLFLNLYKRLHQDYKSYFFLLLTLVLHDLFLYDKSPFGIKFEHYMHFIGGFTIAIVTDRAFNEKLSMAKRFVLLIIFALGFGVIAEIIEWAGYKVLGLGEGFFQYGVGDEGGWDNSIFDLLFNSLGATMMAISTVFRKK